VIQLDLFFGFGLDIALLVTMLQPQRQNRHARRTAQRAAAVMCE
jgi:hypothetical protein